MGADGAESGGLFSHCRRFRLNLGGRQSRVRTPPYFFPEGQTFADIPNQPCDAAVTPTSDPPCNKAHCKIIVMPLSDIKALRCSDRLARRPGTLLVNETTVRMCSPPWSTSGLSDNPLGRLRIDRENLQVTGLTEAAREQIKHLVRNGNTDFDDSTLSAQSERSSFYPCLLSGRSALATEQNYDI